MARISRRALLRSSLGVIPAALAVQAISGTAYATATATTDWRALPYLVPPPGKAFFSVYVDPQDPQLWTKRHEVHQILGHPISCSNVYWHDYDVNDQISSGVHRAQYELNAGSVPRLDWMLNDGFHRAGHDITDIDGTGMSLWAAIAAGYFDQPRQSPIDVWTSGIDQVLTQIGELDAGTCPTNRIFLSLCHEPEILTEGGGTWQGGPSVFGGGMVPAGSQAEFRAMWRHVHDRADALGVKNIVWVLSLAFNPEHPEDPDAPGESRGWGSWLSNTDSDGWYPGHWYVDWVGWDPYNPYQPIGYPTAPENLDWIDWSGIHTYAGDKLGWWNAHFALPGSGMDRPYKPVLIAETGSADYDPAHPVGPGNWHTPPPYSGKAWIRSIRTALASPEAQGIVRGVLYFNVWYADVDRTLFSHWQDPDSKWWGLADIGKTDDPEGWVFAWV